MRVIAAGHICVDLIPSIPASLTFDPGHLYEIGALTFAPGGSVFNTGNALAQLGVNVELMATIGNDELGDLLQRRLSAAGLTANLELSERSRTSYSIVLESPGADRSFWHHVGASADFDGSAVDIRGADALHVGYPPLLPALMGENAAPLIRLLQRAHSERALTSLDLVVVDRDSPAADLPWRDLLGAVLPHVDIFTPSIDDLASAIGPIGDDPTTEIEAAARWALDAGAGVVAVSAGSRGSYVATGSRERLHRGGPRLDALGSYAGVAGWAPAENVTDVVSTNGAGDAFSAGFLVGVLSGDSPMAAGARAAKAAASRIRGQLVDPLTSDVEVPSGARG